MKIEVPLSRAHKIVERLSELVSDAMKEALLEYEPQIALEDFTKEAVMAPVEKVRLLILETQKVKNIIAQANASAGISTHMGDLSAVVKLLSFYTMVQEKSREATGAVVQNLYQDMKTVYRRSSAPNLVQEITELQMRKNYLSDLISVANQTQVILDLPDDLMTLVRGFPSNV